MKKKYWIQIVCCVFKSLRWQSLQEKLCCLFLTLILITDFPYLITATYSKPEICPKQRIKKKIAFSFGGWDKGGNIFWDFVDFTTRCIYLMNYLHLNLQLDRPKDEVQQLRTTVVMQIFSYLCAFLTNYADLVYSTKNFREEDPCQQKTWKDKKKKRIIVSSEFYA